MNEIFKHGIILFLFCVLLVDVFVDPPKGFGWLRQVFGLKLYGAGSSDSCGWDDEGRWNIGMVVGESPWQWTNEINNKDLPIITCADLFHDDTKKKMSASFVADPFLVQISDTDWYIFFEYKNIDRMIGEIGVSYSSDGGKSWEYQGTALKETFHLSYPNVIRQNDEEHLDVYQMIPETESVKEVRVYETSKEDFPFGWKLAHTALHGEKYLNTGAVWHEGQFWIFTNVYHGNRRSSLHLYHTKSLTEDPWVEHPMSPIVKNDKQFARSAGRPIVHNGNIYRYAQDGTDFFGQGIHIFRVHVLTYSIYREQHMTYIQPGSKLLPTKARFHHMDVQKVKKNETTHWLAIYDVDDEMENSRYFQREGWFYLLKRITLFFLGYYIFTHIFQELLVINFQYFYILYYQGIYTPLKQAGKAFLTYCQQLGLRKLILEILGCQKAKSASILLKWMLKIVLCLILAIITTDIKNQCVESNSRESSECFSLLQTKFKYNEKSPPFLNNDDTYNRRLGDPDGSNNSIGKNKSDSHKIDTFKDKKSLIIVTACSSTYFIRLRNFVGSLHFWEPDMHLIIYDIGLSERDLAEISQWKKVELRFFDFKKYPPHVSLLFNFAWKVLVIKEVLDHHENVLWLDSGIEIRHPLVAVKHFLEKDGYYSTYLDDRNTIHRIGFATHPKIYERLKDYGIEFDEKEMAKQPFCGGNVQGFSRDRSAPLFDLWVKCALEQSCIAPDGSNEENHNYDQSAISIIAYAQDRGSSCNHKNIFIDENASDYTVDETRCNHMEMGARRWRIHRPYTKHIDLHLVKQPKIERTVSFHTIERTQRVRLKLHSEIKFKKCLEECEKEKDRNKWELCSDECRTTHMPKNNISLNMIAWTIDYWYYLSIKGCKCTLIRIKTLIFILCIQIIPFFRRKIQKSKKKTTHLHRS